MKFFRVEIEENELSLEKWDNSTEIYNKWMEEFEVFRNETLEMNANETEAVTLKNFFEQRLYPK